MRSHFNPLLGHPDIDSPQGPNGNSGHWAAGLGPMGQSLMNSFTAQSCRTKSHPATTLPPPPPNFSPSPPTISTQCLYVWFPRQTSAAFPHPPAPTSAISSSKSY